MAPHGAARRRKRVSHHCAGAWPAPGRGVRAAAACAFAFASACVSARSAGCARAHPTLASTLAHSLARAVGHCAQTSALRCGSRRDRARRMLALSLTHWRVPRARGRDRGRDRASERALIVGARQYARGWARACAARAHPRAPSYASLLHPCARARAQRGRAARSQGRPTLLARGGVEGGHEDHRAGDGGEEQATGDERADEVVQRRRRRGVRGQGRGERQRGGGGGGLRGRVVGGRTACVGGSARRGEGARARSRHNASERPSGQRHGSRMSGRRRRLVPRGGGAHAGD